MVAALGSTRTATPRGERDHPRRPADTNLCTRRDCNGRVGIALRGRGSAAMHSGAAARRAQAAPLPEGTRRTHHSGKGGHPTREEAGRKGRSPAGAGDARNHARTCPPKRLSDKSSGRLRKGASNAPSPSGCRAGDDGQRPTAQRRPAHCATGGTRGEGARPGSRMAQRGRQGAPPPTKAASNTPTICRASIKGCGLFGSQPLRQRSPA